MAGLRDHPTTDTTEIPQQPPRHRRLTARYQAWQRSEISFGELHASVQGWINHAGFADSWALRRRVLQRAFEGFLKKSWPPQAASDQKAPAFSEQ